MHSAPMAALSSSATLAEAPSAAHAAAELSSLDHYLLPMQWLLADTQVTEICINSPGSAWVERYSGWKQEDLPFCTFDWCMSLASLVSNFTKQRVSATEPILSATLPSGERVQFVLPPVAGDGCVSITIRKPSIMLWTLDQLASEQPIESELPDGQRAILTLDVFRDTLLMPKDRDVADVVLADGSDGDRELIDLLRGRKFMMFLRRAVQLRKNILLSGATGSGKTTIAKALILEVPPDDRIVTIEDVRELVLRNQPNSVSMLYSQGGQGQAKVTGGDLLVSAKRMRPDRVFVSELRTGDEAYDYLVSINSGHPGSITSVHADTAEGAFVALAQIMKRSEAGKGMSTREGVELAQLNVDVVVQCARIKQRRCVSEIWYDPSTKRRGLA
jgi:type IV secretion system protein VirB11